MADEQGTGPRGGIDRRELIKRGAVAGGIVWAMPVIDSFTSPAGASLNTPQDLGGCAFSYIAFTMTCGGGARYRIKFDGASPWPQAPTCGTFNAPDCEDITPAFPDMSATYSEDCPAGLDADYDATTKDITFHLPAGCVIDGNKGWVHKGNIPNKCVILTGSASGSDVTFSLNGIWSGC